MSKQSVYITKNDFPSIMYELLEQKFEIDVWNSLEKGVIPKNKLTENIKGRFGLVCSTTNIIDKEIIEAGGNNLKVVATFSAGFEHLDIKELKSRGIRVGYSPVNDLTEAVAEFAIGLLISTSRHVVETQQLILKGGWTSSVWTPTWMCGHGLYSSSVGIVGCGRVGISIMEKVKAFDPKHIFYYSRSEKSEADALDGEWKPLDYIMKESDFIIISLAMNNDTKEIINKERINCMRPNAIIVNVGRGGLIDENALIEALQNKKIGGAGLDVFAHEPLSTDSPLLKMDNVVTTPHIAGCTLTAGTAAAEFAALNVIAVLNNERMAAEV